jgi:hypothetical protein
MQLPSRTLQKMPGKTDNLTDLENLTEESMLLELTVRFALLCTSPLRSS